jgi:hypothetical protein
LAAEMPFHGGNRGSNPLGDANIFNGLKANGLAVVQHSSNIQTWTPGVGQAGPGLDEAISLGLQASIEPLRSAPCPFSL